MGAGVLSLSGIEEIDNLQVQVQKGNSELRKTIKECKVAVVVFRPY